YDEADAETRHALLSQSRNLFAARHWDEALSVAEISRDAAFVTEAIAAALDDLLAAGRASSLERWVAAARAAGAESGLIDYAESEALLRRGEFDRALGIASIATRSLAGDLAARAHLVSARAAHLNDRSQVTRTHTDMAAELALTEKTREDASWLRYLAALERQSPDLRQRLEDFNAAARPGMRAALLSAAASLNLAEIEGGLGAALGVARTVVAAAT